MEDKGDGAWIIQLPDKTTYEYKPDVRGIPRVHYAFSYGSFEHYGTLNRNGMRHGVWYLQAPDRATKKTTFWFMGRQVREDEIDALMAQEPNGGW
jgi:hypothetical protein